ncbi:MAG: BamA/TamA family outer membrane protein, partial [Pseudohongiellaceae bacterium]
GTITGSIGYAQVQGLVFSASLQQNNFLGTGKQVGIGANTSRFSTNYNVSYFDPYYTIDGVSRGFSLNYTQSDFAELNLASYSTNQIGGNISYGYQISEVQSMGFNFGYSRTKIDSGFSAVQEIKSSPDLIPGISDYIVQARRDASTYDPQTGQIYPITDAVTAPVSGLPQSAIVDTVGFLDREGDTFNNFQLSVSWSKSTLNRGLFPTVGNQQSLQLQFTVPGSDLEFFKVNYFNDMYIPVIGEWIVHTRLQLGYGDGYGDTEQLPFFQNYYAGGLGTIRGFERNTLGPRSTPPARFQTTPSKFLKDGNGDIIFDSFGTPILNENSEAYQLEQATDAQGQLIFDETGQPVYLPKLDRRFLFEPSLAGPFGGN